MVRDIENKVQQIEELIRYSQNKERAVYLDKYGHVLADTKYAPCESSKEEVILDNEDIVLPYTEIVVHSHPVKMYKKCYWGSSFSSIDLAHGFSKNIKEFRFCDRYYTGIIRRIGDTYRNDWGKIWHKNVKNKISEELSDYLKKFEKKLERGEITMSEYLRDYQHVPMTEFAKKHKFDYQRILRHPVPKPPADLSKLYDEDFKKKHPHVVFK